MQRHSLMQSDVLDAGGDRAAIDATTTPGIVGGKSVTIVSTHAAAFRWWQTTSRCRESPDVGRGPRPHRAGMAPDRSPAPHVSFHTYLAERYRAGTSHAAARRESEAARLAALELSREGRPVTLIGSLLVPSDETVFSLFGASSRDDVAAVGERAAQPFDRISEGVPVTPPRARRGDLE